MQHSTGYIIRFAVMVCFVCALVVASAAVGLKGRQQENLRLDRQKKVLAVAGLMREGEHLANAQIKTLFEENVQARVIDLRSGEYVDDVAVADYDQRAASKDPDASEVAPSNKAKVMRIPHLGMIYQVIEKGAVKSIIIPIEGKGLWSTLYGYLALEPDTTTIRGITFYEHGETPGLGGEVDNVRWKALWPGRRAFDNRWRPAIEVIKGHAGTPEEDPNRVDGLSGATITSRGVSNLVRFWLGEDGFGPFLARVREQPGT